MQNCSMRCCLACFQLSLKIAHKQAGELELATKPKLLLSSCCALWQEAKPADRRFT